VRSRLAPAIRAPGIPAVTPTAEKRRAAAQVRLPFPDYRRTA
jgi:hypothetical protein